MEFLKTVIFPALAIVVSGLASWCVAVLVNWLNSKIKNEKVRASLENTRDIITAEVAKTSQKFVDDLKNGFGFSAEKQVEAFKMTLESVKKQLTAEATDAIKAISADVEEWIAAEIEKAVAESKKGG